MSAYTIKRDHIVGTTVDELWAFLTNPNNLQKLTPKKFGGKRIDDAPIDTIEEGLMVTYRIRILPFISVKWTAKFVDVCPKESFADVQVKGPFKSWKHTHTIISHRGNVIMRDEITFEPPFPVFDAFMHKTFIVGRLHKLFNYRDKYLDDHFKQSNVKFVQ